MEAILADCGFFLLSHHHTFYFCASVVSIAAFLIFCIIILHFYFFICCLSCFNSTFVDQSVLYSVDTFTLVEFFFLFNLGGGILTLMKWKCYFYSPGLPFRVRERKGRMTEVGTENMKSF